MKAVKLFERHNLKPMNLPSLGKGKFPVATFHCCPYCHAVLPPNEYTWDKMNCRNCGERAFMSTVHTSGYMWIWNERREP